MASIIRRLKDLKKNGMAIHWLKIHGGPMQRSGEPDLHVTLNGRSLWLEVKRPGEQATELQNYRLSLWRDSGAKTAVISSVEELNEIMEHD